MKSISPDTFFGYTHFTKALDAASKSIDVTRTRIDLDRAP
jgi:hypothetical protein